MIETIGLCKRFGGFTAVDGVAFRAEPGEVLGMLGPNGAGKSTTMKMVAGFLRPSAGTARVCGHDVMAEPLQARRALGYLPEGAPSYGEMSVHGFLRFVAEARGLDAGQVREAVGAASARLGLDEVARQPVDTLSKGFRRRVALAAAIAHGPRALLLDEPTDGLDPNQKHEVRGLIREMARERAVVLSTHLLEEVSTVCTRALVIARGRVLADDTPAGLEARSRWRGAVSVAVDDTVAARAAMERADGVTAVEADGPGRLVAFPKRGREVAEAVAAALRARGLEARELRVERGRLEEVFRTLTLAAAQEAQA